MRSDEGQLAYPTCQNLREDTQVQVVFSGLDHLLCSYRVDPLQSLLIVGL